MPQKVNRIRQKKSKAFAQEAAIEKKVTERNEKEKEEKQRKNGRKTEEKKLAHTTLDCLLCMQNRSENSESEKTIPARKFGT